MSSLCNVRKGLLSPWRLTKVNNSLAALRLDFVWVFYDLDK